MRSRPTRLPFYSLRLNGGLVSDPVDLIAALGPAALYKVEFMLWPDRWLGFPAAITLDWSSRPFDRSVAGSIVTAPGVYAFVVEPRVPRNLGARYPLYIGKTDRGLRRRFREYLDEADGRTSKPRSRMKRMFLTWRSHLRFYFAQTPAGYAPADVENVLLECLIPPMNDQLPASVSAPVRAFR